MPGGSYKVNAGWIGDLVLGVPVIEQEEKRKP
jgi:hypothetical protein